jgi:hypothetical protein
MACLELLAALAVESQHLKVELDPAAHRVSVETRLEVRGAGVLRLQLTDAAQVATVQLDGRELEYRRTAGATGIGRLELAVPADGALTMRYTASLEQDVGAGERPGQIHNFSVDAHIGEDGVFLSDNAAWHPLPIDEHDRRVLHVISADITPMVGWALVASGDPAGGGALTEPRWRWSTPRPVEGMAIVGNRHQLHGAVHETPHGPVEIVMHVPASHARLAPMFVEAATRYLDLYTPLLGPFPYRRFSIVENFFSSGFAFPGFTVLGPRVVGMAPRSLAPGYLDHELVHNWWGNGVYVDSSDGNWCEALTSYCANYFRRLAEDGEEAAEAYRRGILMKLSTDPANLDNGPLGDFGSADPTGGGPDRFVGYDKGTFVFVMLEDALPPRHAIEQRDLPFWSALRLFTERHLGRRAGWDELRACFEAQASERPAGWLDGFFDVWVRRHTVPHTVPAPDARLPEGFDAQYAASQRAGHDRSPDGASIEIDPHFRLYRVLPPEQIIPTIGGTLGVGGVLVTTLETRPEVASYLPQLERYEKGENRLLIGRGAAASEADLIASAADPITIEDGRFTVGGKTYDGETDAVLHSMPYPGRPGRFITVFHANGDAGWSRLRLIGFYTRDTTIVWRDGEVLERRVFEPDRRIRVEGGRN